jgi:hypothetical protein
MSPTPTDPHPDHDTEAIGRAIQAAARTVQAPAALRAGLAGQRARDGRRGAWRLGGRPALAAGLAALAAAVVLAVGGLPGGGGAGPSLDAAAALALARPTAAPPPVDAGNAALLHAQVGGVPFPNYAWSWEAWRTAGARQDRVGGRDATTVVYRGPAGDVGYTIVGGRPLEVPAGARHLTVAGVDLSVVRHGGATIMTWRRGGHTCVLAARNASVEQLARFATYNS